MRFKRCLLLDLDQRSFRHDSGGPPSHAQCRAKNMLLYIYQMQGKEQDFKRKDSIVRGAWSTSWLCPADFSPLEDVKPPCCYSQHQESYRIVRTENPSGCPNGPFHEYADVTQD